MAGPVRDQRRGMRQSGDHVWQAVEHGGARNQHAARARRRLPTATYNLALAAVPSQQDTLVMAGANDLWKCSLAMGCVWRNTTNATTCMSAQVGEFQHALAWNAANPLEIFCGQRQRAMALDGCDW